MPGNATYPVQIHYAPEGSAVPTGQLLLENYLQGVDSSTTIQGSQSSTETLKAKATAGRVKWLQSESTIKVRPGQKAAFDGLMDIWRKGVKMVCGISFKLTVV